MGTLVELTRNPDLAGFVMPEIGLLGGARVLFIKHNTTECVGGVGGIVSVCGRCLWVSSINYQYKRTTKGDQLCKMTART